MNRLQVYGCVGLSLFLTVAIAQPRIVSLRDCLELAHRQGPDAQMAKQTFEAATWQYAASNAGYLPQLSLTGDLPGLVRAISSVTQNDGSVLFRDQSQTYSRLNLSLSQKIALTGGQLFVSSGLNRVDLFGPPHTFYWQSTPVILGIPQPLFKFNSIRWDRRIENLQYRLAEQRYKESLAAVDVTVAQRFFEVYIARINVNLAQLNLAVNDTIYTISRGRYSVGKIAENDLLQSELARMNAEVSLTGSQLEFERAWRQLKLTLNVPLDSDLELSDPPTVENRNLDTAALIRTAKEHTSTLLRYSLQRLQAERNLRQTKSDNHFGANFTASWGYNKSDTGVAAVYSNAFGQQRFTVGFEIPLLTWGRGKAQVQAAQTNEQQARLNEDYQTRQFEQAVLYQIQQFNQLQQNMILSAKADTIGTRQFEVTKNRYLIGRVDITNLLRAQQEKDAARKNYIQNLKNYWLAYYQLKRLTLAEF